MNKLRCISAGFVLMAVAAATGAEDTRTQIFDPAFRTLKVQVDGDFMAPPVIMLGSDRRITVSFDEMADEETGNERSYLRWSLTHCGPDWQPSRLLESEYLDSFNEAEVTDYAFSQSVYRHYINYRITVPSERMDPKLSGNYLLKVWREEESAETPVLQARFCVSEEAVRVIGDVSTQTDRGTNGEWQQLNLEVLTGEHPVRDPWQDIIMTVEMNGVEQPQVERLKPLRVEPGRMVYEHLPALIFPAGNEFRRFETVRTDYRGMHIAENAYEHDGYTATLQTDFGRADRPYSYDRTQNGRFKIDEYNSTDPDLGADYVLTRFTLDFPRLMNGDIYVDGEFTHNLTDDSTRMRYNEAKGLYELEMLLKQGSYNYRYVARERDNRSLPDVALVEGNHYETQNEYTVKVFQQAPGDRYARLLNVVTIR
ncbi:MAG: DUF5103 domain-containing protein [Muribaculaceae bacterium]|nr:DUF5103 domain-containing protein [Muribaculaceae bacterium]